MPPFKCGVHGGCHLLGLAGSHKYCPKPMTKRSLLFMHTYTPCIVASDVHSAISRAHSRRAMCSPRRFVGVAWQEASLCLSFKCY